MRFNAGREHFSSFVMFPRGAVVTVFFRDAGERTEPGVVGRVGEEVEQGLPGAAEPLFVEISRVEQLEFLPEMFAPQGAGKTVE